jgi:hypothetical protein
MSYGANETMVPSDAAVIHLQVQRVARMAAPGTPVGLESGGPASDVAARHSAGSARIRT